MSKAEIIFYKLAEEKRQIGATSSGGFKANVAKQFNTADGPRYYSGSGSSKGLNLAVQKAGFAAKQKMTSAPADSMTTQQFKGFQAGQIK